MFEIFINGAKIAEFQFSFEASFALEQLGAGHSQARFMIADLVRTSEPQSTIAFFQKFSYTVTIKRS